MPSASEVATQHKVTQTPSLPESSAGVGFHYHPDSEHYRSQDLAAWLPELQSLGARWLTVHGELGRAIPEVFLAPLLQAGITPIVHIPVNPIQSLDPLQVRWKFFSQTLAAVLLNQFPENLQHRCRLRRHVKI